MRPKPPLTYVDACVFLSYINGDEDRRSDIEDLFARADKGEITLITSVLSVVEVAFGKEEQDNRALDPATKAEIDKLWAPGGPVTLVEFHQLIAEDARDIVRSGLEKQPDQWRLKPGDAVHLATAQANRVRAFYSYSGDLPRYSGLLGFPIMKPPAAAPTLWSERTEDEHKPAGDTEQG
jgi:predicted nucleic acid-binding protein